MLEKSKCHTLDRDNMQAQLDCNQLALVEEAAVIQFEIDHWPYTRDPEVKKCFEMINKNAY